MNSHPSINPWKSLIESIDFIPWIPWILTLFLHGTTPWWTTGWDRGRNQEERAQVLSNRLRSMPPICKYKGWGPQGSPGSLAAGVGVRRCSWWLGMVRFFFLSMFFHVSLFEKWMRSILRGNHFKIAVSCPKLAGPATQPRLYPSHTRALRWNLYTAMPGPEMLIARDGDADCWLRLLER